MLFPFPVKPYRGLDGFSTDSIVCRLMQCVIKSPQSGVTMFSVRFRCRVRVHRRRRRRNDFCFSHQNRFSFTLDIWDKESIGLGKCTG